MSQVPWALRRLHECCPARRRHPRQSSAEVVPLLRRRTPRLLQPLRLEPVLAAAEGRDHQHRSRNLRSADDPEDDPPHLRCAQGRLLPHRRPAGASARHDELAVAASVQSGMIQATGETGVASLAMYDLPEVRAATDAWWRGLAAAFRREGIAEVPDRLDRATGHHEVCLRPDLLFAQTCGYPLTHALAGRVALVATPCYAAEGCAGASYCSFIVVAGDNPATAIADLRGARCAVNAPDSQSGYSALRAAVAPHARNGRFFSSVVVSGSHVASLQLVAAGATDVAAIDCVTHALVARYRPAALEGTRVL